MIHPCIICDDKTSYKKDDENIDLPANTPG